MDTILPSQPCGYAELIKRSFRLYNISFAKVALLSLMLSIIIFIPRLISDFVGQEIMANIPAISWHRLWITGIHFIGLFFFIAIIWHMYCLTQERREPFMEDLRVGAKKVFYVFVATILQSLVVVALILLIFEINIYLHQYNYLPISGEGWILTGIFLIAETFVTLYVSTLFIFLIPLIAIENKGIVGSLERSVYLSWNHWWRIFSAQVTPWICYYFILYFLKFGLKINIHLYFIEHGSHPLWSSLLNILVFAVFIPWVPALLLVQLKDLELRKHITV